MALGQHLRNCLQLASQTTDMEQRRLLLTVAVIGAGQVVLKWPQLLLICCAGTKN